MSQSHRVKSPGRRRRVILVPVTSEREFAYVQAIDYLIRLDMLPPPCRRKRARHDTWLGLALFLPLVLLVVCELIAG